MTHTTVHKTIDKDGWKILIEVVFLVTIDYDYDGWQITDWSTSRSFLCRKTKRRWNHTYQNRTSNGFRNTRIDDIFLYTDTTDISYFFFSMISNVKIPYSLCIEITAVNISPARLIRIPLIWGVIQFISSLVEYKCVERIPVLRRNRSSAKEVV